VQLDPVHEGRQATAVQYFHVLLYVIMVAMVSSGIVAVWFRGVNMFDLLTEVDPRVRTNSSVV
jgi:cytochrome b561